MIKAPTGFKSEVVSKRTINSKTFDMGNGRFILACTQNPEHVPDGLTRFDESKSFNWIDPTITITLIDSIYKVRGGWFKANVNANNISVEYINRKGTKFRMRLDKIGGSTPLTPSKITVQNNYITWHDVSKDVDIQLQFRPMRMEWFKRMKSANAARQFDWTIQEDVDNVDKFDGNSVGYDNENELVDGKQRHFFANTQFSTPVISNGISTYRFRETWDGNVIQKDGATRIKSIVNNPVYPVLLDASITVDITANGDDGHSKSGNWVITPYLNHIILWNGGAGAEYSGAWRFLNVTVPQGSTINTASLDIYAQRSATITVTFQGEDVDNASAWGNSSANDSRTMTKTTASNAYTFSSGTGTKSIDLKTIVQEVVNRSGWSSGNAMRVGTTDLPASNYQYLDDYSKSGATQIGQLNIDYTEVGTAIAVTKQSLILSAKNSSVNAVKSFLVTKQTLTLTAYNTSVNVGTTVAVTRQSLVLSEKTVAVNAVKNITVTKQGLVVTAYNVGINVGTNLIVTKQALILNEKNATVQQVTGTNIVVTQQTLTLSEKAVSINAVKNITVVKDSLILTTYVATVTSGATSTTYKTSTSKQIVVNLTDTGVPLNIAVDDSGGVAGLTITAQIRDAGDSSSYFDFSDSTFKTSGWVMKTATLTEYGSGFYGTTLDISSITNFPSGNHATVEFTVSGALLAVDSSLLSMNQTWLDSKALTVGKFIGLS